MEVRNPLKVSKMDEPESQMFQINNGMEDIEYDSKDKADNIKVSMDGLRGRLVCSKIG